MMSDYGLVSLKRNVRDVQPTALQNEFLMVLDLWLRIGDGIQWHGCGSCEAEACMMLFENAAYLPWAEINWQVEGDAHLEVCAELVVNVESRKSVLLSEINQSKRGYFEQEVQKLDAWAVDLKLELKQEIKAIDGETKEVCRIAAASPTLDETLAHQKRQRELETKRSKLRRELFARQDDIEMQRNTLIEQYREQLEHRVKEQVLFNVERGPQ